MPRWMSKRGSTREAASSGKMTPSGVVTSSSASLTNCRVELDSNIDRRTMPINQLFANVSGTIAIA